MRTARRLKDGGVNDGVRQGCVAVHALRMYCVPEPARRQRCARLVLDTVRAVHPTDSPKTVVVVVVMVVARLEDDFHHPRAG